MIYVFAIASAKRAIKDMENFDCDCFPSSMDNPGGFYYPLSHNLPILKVRKQIR
jgi:hypothetical protein